MIRVRRLTDAYIKDADSNNAKLLDLPDREDGRFLEAMKHVEAWRDIDSAEGATLDIIGEGLGQTRGAASDAQYRILLWAQVARILCTGDINSVLWALGKTFQCDPREIQLTEIQNCVMKLAKMNLSHVVAAGFGMLTVRELVESLIPVGVRLDEAWFQANLEAAPAQVYVGTALRSWFHFDVLPA